MKTMKTKEKIYRPCAVCGDRATGYHYKVYVHLPQSKTTTKITFEIEYNHAKLFVLIKRTKLDQFIFIGRLRRVKVARQVTYTFVI